MSRFILFSQNFCQNQFSYWQLTIIRAVPIKKDLYITCIINIVQLTLSGYYCANNLRLETGVKCQFLEEIWIQWLLLWISFCTQKLTKYASFKIQKVTQKLTCNVSVFSGSRNWNFGSISGSRKWHCGREVLYATITTTTTRIFFLTLSSLTRVTFQNDQYSLKFYFKK